MNIKCKKSYECSIGDNENCKTCDSEEKKNCDSCNDGYYLSKDDKTKCIKSIIKDDDVINYPELSEKEAFDKIYKDMGLRDSFVENEYCQQHNQ